ncbi:DMT family transporter [Aquitalea aquatilis]|uniref:DMT family transporter n=1 Tax=Aquitalea aquatilis TaxID=1537400 RepID=UPI0010BD493E|nr:DMT family transporter [Aquitalea aquatilis]
MPSRHPLHQRYPALPDLLLLLVAMVWGSSYGLAKEALQFYPVLGVLALRFGLSFLLLLPAQRALADPAIRRATLGAALPLGLGLLAIFLCETYGIAHTSAANAAFLISLCLVLTPFAEWLLLGQQPSRDALLAAAAALCGAWLLSGATHLQLNGGDLLILLAAVLRAAVTSLTRKLTADRPVATLALTGLQGLLICLGCLLLASLNGGLPALPARAAFWGDILFLVLFCTLFAFFAMNYALRHSSATRVALLTGSEPVFGALFAMLWLGETLSASSWLGGLLMVAASLWAVRPGRLQTAAA